MNETSNDEKKTHSRKYHEKLQTALWFVGKVIFFTLLIYLFAKNVPKWMRLETSSGFIRSHVLPLTFFTSFSFVFGVISLNGVINLMPLFSEIYSNKVVDLGAVSIFAGIFSIFIGSQFTQITEQVIGYRIQSTLLYDIIGYGLGRLLSMLLFVGSKYNTI